MSSAAGGGDRSGGGDDGDGGNLQNNVAVAALAAALVALIVSTFQLLQQYYGSATGLASCNETVMGKWSVFTKRRFIWKEFRFQVCFSAPVLFVSPPSNTSGPLGKHENKEIVYLNGKTYDDSHTWTQEEYDMIREDGLAAHATRETVHTADNELSTWVGLLMAIQRMEQESADWAKKINTKVLLPAKKINTEVLPPAGDLPGLDQGAPDDGQHTLMVGMQIKQRTWDAMPSDLKKPYATSTMCHVVEILAMLGIHWRQFDRISNTYHAQGNGFIVTGSVVPSLGVAFTFEKAGKTWFQETRLVPNEKVKQLCFGYCPSIFQQLDLNVPLYADEAQDHGTLQLGTKAELAETLLSFDCNTNTINYFRLGNPHTRYSHLFPVAFEMLGMVGEVIHIHHTPFTMLPNPTGFTWDKSTMSLINMLNAFRKQLSQSLVEDHNGSKLAEVRDSPRIRRILQDAQLAVIDAGLERDLAQIEDAGLIAERYYRKNKTDRDKKDCEPQQKRQVIMTSAASPSPSSLISIIILVITVIALIFRPVIMLLRPLALLVVHVSSEVKDLLVKIDLIKDEHAEKVRKIARPLAPDAQPRPSKQTMINTLHDAIDRCDEFLRTNRKHTRYVFALHMEELMGYLNARPSYAHDDDDDLDDDDAAASDRAGLGPGMGLPDAGGPRNRTRSRRGYASSSTRISSPHPSDTGHYNSDYVPLHSIDVATWNERDALLMQVYIKFIRKRVVETEIPKTLKKYTAVTPDSPADWPGLLRQDSLSKEMRQTRLRELLDKMPKEGKKAAQVNFDNNTSAAPSQAPYQRVYRHSFRSRRHSRSHRVEPAAPQAQDTAQQDQDDAKLKEQLKKALEELSQAILMDNEDNEPCTTSAGTPGASSSAGAAIATTTAAAAAAIPGCGS